jgi:DNA-binding response OmpR family regulator
MHVCPGCGLSLRKFEPVTFGNVMIDHAGDIYFEGTRIHLTSNLRIAAEALIRSQGRALTMDAISNLVNEDMTNNGIRQLIKRVRDVFRLYHPEFNQIATVQKIGYQWRYAGAMQAAA